MFDANIWLGQFLTVMLIAIALGFDAFSLGIGIGLKGIRTSEVIRLSFIIGLFHIIMPIGGMLTGKMMGALLGGFATLTAGLLLVILGLHMIYSSFKQEEAQIFDHRSLLGILLLAFSVSVDSFSVGITLGMFYVSFWLTVCLFGVFGGIMAMLGLFVGQRFSLALGDYGEAFGGVILVVFGIYFII